MSQKSTFSGQKVTFGVTFRFTLGDPESHSLVSLELLLILRGFGLLGPRGSATSQGYFVKLASKEIALVSGQSVWRPIARARLWGGASRQASGHEDVRADFGRTDLAPIVICCWGGTSAE